MPQVFPKVLSLQGIRTAAHIKFPGLYGYPLQKAQHLVLYNGKAGKAVT